MSFAKFNHYSNLPIKPARVDFILVLLCLSEEIGFKVTYKNSTQHTSSEIVRRCIFLLIRGSVASVAFEIQID